MSYTIEELHIGQTASFTKTISESDVYLFAGITGDFNPAHVNAAYAGETTFKRRIVHGMLSASFISTVIATYVPGEGSIYLDQEVKFKSPVYFGDTITAKVEVIEINTLKNRVRLRTVCTNQNNVLVVDGEATIMPPTKKNHDHF